MALKSCRLLKTLKKKGSKQKTKKKEKPLGHIVKGGITAMIGIGLLSETASAVHRI